MTQLAAIKILVVGGVANIVLSFVLGFVLSAKRMKGPMAPHRWLLVAHEVSLQEGTMLLGLGFAMTFASLSRRLLFPGPVLAMAPNSFASPLKRPPRSPFRSRAVCLPTHSVNA